MIDTQDIIDELLPTLHADSRALLTWWTEADLIAWIDESLKHLSNSAMLFVERDTTSTTAIGTATYPLPNRQISTIHVSYNHSALRPGTVAELGARDEQFQTTQGDPTHWYQDTIGLDSIGLAPVPSSEAELDLICAVTPLEVDTAKVNTLVEAPTPLKSYLAFSILARAYGRESECEEPELARHCQARIELMDQLFEHYYGESI
jgi:hypothetical protein